MPPKRGGTGRPGLPTKPNAKSSSSANKRRKLDVSSSTQSSIEEEVDDEHSAVLCETTKGLFSKFVSLWHCTPLSKLDHSFNRMKRIANGLKQELNFSTGRSFGITVRTLEGIADKDNDGRSVIIEVQESSDQNDDMRTNHKPQSCKAVLGCRRNKMNRFRPLPQQNGYLPILVGSGALSLLGKLVDAIMKVCDCRIMRIAPFSPADLIDLSGPWLVRDLVTTCRDSEASFKLEGQSSNALTITLGSQFVKNLINNEVDVQPCRLWDALYLFFYQNNFLHFDEHSRLLAVETSRMVINSKGQLKVKLATLDEVESLWQDLTAFSETFVRHSLK